MVSVTTPGCAGLALRRYKHFGHCFSVLLLCSVSARTCAFGSVIVYATTIVSSSIPVPLSVFVCVCACVRACMHLCASVCTCVSVCSCVQADVDIVFANLDTGVVTVHDSLNLPSMPEAVADGFLSQ